MAVSLTNFLDSGCIVASSLALTAWAAAFNFGSAWTWGSRTSALAQIEVQMPPGFEDGLVPIDFTAPSAVSP